MTVDHGGDAVKDGNEAELAHEAVKDSKNATTAADYAAWKKLDEVVRRAQIGDRTALPELRKALDEHPERFGYAGDLALMSQHTWLDLLSGTDLYIRETVERTLQETRIELAGSNPSPLEKLLVERIVACWLQVNHADTVFVNNQSSSEAFRKELMKRQESAQRRYVEGIKQLAQVRKLVSPKAGTVNANASEDPLVAVKATESDASAATFPRIARVV
jgi:hypothetical protein